MMSSTEPRPTGVDSDRLSGGGAALDWDEAGAGAGGGALCGSVIDGGSEPAVQAAAASPGTDAAAALTGRIGGEQSGIPTRCVSTSDSSFMMRLAALKAAVPRRTVCRLPSLLLWATRKPSLRSL